MTEKRLGKVKQKKQKMKYLFGASVQSIQSYIFQTNKLKEIIGGSEIVENICKKQYDGLKDEAILLNAAGNIKYVFDDLEKCKVFVRKFKKEILKEAPGIQICQAVVEYSELTKEVIYKLENKLKAQKNKLEPNIRGGYMVVETARRTGRPGVTWSSGDNREVLDEAQKVKIKQSEAATKTLVSKIISVKDSNVKFPLNVEEIVNNRENSWLAVIHADGNNIGQFIINMFNKVKPENTTVALKKFSAILNESTEAACKYAYDKVIKVQEGETIPMRPLILGGDDFTAVIRGDLALEFTKEYLLKFEEYTKFNFKTLVTDFEELRDYLENGFSACAGIAYIKVNYPLHYGVKLADDLCKHSKKVSKKLSTTFPPTSLMFHKVHSSFIEDYEEIQKKELTTKEGLKFDFGPYFTKEQKEFSKIEDLEKLIKSLKAKDSPAAGLRNWLTELQSNEAIAEQLLNRIKSMPSYEKYINSLKLEHPFTVRQKRKLTHIYDAIALMNI
jgi:hypothetical protein